MASTTNLINHMRNCLNKNLQGCADYFGVENPKLDWCAWLVRMCGSKSDVNMNFGSSMFAKELKGIKGNFQFKVGAYGTTNNKPKVGDLLFIDTSNSGTVNHVAVCIGVESNGNIKSYEGNVSGEKKDWINTSIVREGFYNYNSGSSSWGTIINYGSNS